MRKLAIFIVLAVFLFSGCAAKGDAEDKTFITAAEAFLTHLTKGEYEAARENFDDAMLDQVTAEGLEEMWNGLTAQIGAFEKQTASRTTEEGGYRMAYLTCAFAEETIDMRIVFNEDGQIAGLQFLPATISE